ncbi:hypothetical protein BpHYR1_009969 [Brachionus plicatilis]|uniref:Uncharacterized protein n=1 Tax=Brachionus plicatilis TaxID=10195 RepID=A0A3M7PWA2_BRAPC|nr:hypothetical protein BpHYR1_009969 [Brachionus plicatilis]
MNSTHKCYCDYKAGARVFGTFADVTGCNDMAYLIAKTRYTSFILKHGPLRDRRNNKLNFLQLFFMTKFYALSRTIETLALGFLIPKPAFPAPTNFLVQLFVFFQIMENEIKMNMALSMLFEHLKHFTKKYAIFINNKKAKKIYKKFVEKDYANF